LQTLAFMAVAEDSDLPAEMRVKLISILADASGTPTGMVSGQQLDLSAEGNALTIDEIEQIHRQKTGALISAAAVLGAVIAGADDGELTAIRQYADKLGLLFQITDDLLDVTQETGKLGKTAGKDAAAKKATYPAHYGVDETRRIATAISAEAREALSPIDVDTRLLSELVGSIVSRTA
jgi:geranylgeranyl pyrophosphate synthase